MSPDRLMGPEEAEFARKFGALLVDLDDASYDELSARAAAIVAEHLRKYPAGLLTRTMLQRRLLEFLTMAAAEKEQPFAVVMACYRKLEEAGFENVAIRFQVVLLVAKAAARDDMLDEIAALVRDLRSAVMSDQTLSPDDREEMKSLIGLHAPKLWDRAP